MRIMSILLSLFLLLGPPSPDVRPEYGSTDGVPAAAWTEGPSGHDGSAAVTRVPGLYAAAMSGFADAYAAAVLEGLDQVEFTYPADGDWTVDAVRALVRSSDRMFYRNCPEWSMYASPQKFKVFEDGEVIRAQVAMGWICPEAKEWAAESVVLAESVADGLREGFADGATQREQASAALDWVMGNMCYKYDGPASTTAYNGFVNGYGACGAYTGMYNLILWELGIRCRGRYGTDPSGECHVWTLAELDGEWLNVDATWCDSAKYRNDRYFAVPDADLSGSHVWDESWMSGWTAIGE